LVIIGVSIDTDRNAFERAVSKAALPWPQVFDGGDKGPLVRLFNAHGVPVSILIDRDGRIANRITAESELRMAVTKLLEKR
jgi:hypothetical protein